MSDSEKPEYWKTEDEHILMASDSAFELLKGLDLVGRLSAITYLISKLGLERYTENFTEFFKILKDPS